MRRTTLSQPKGHDDVERMFSCLEETVNRGASVIFSFSSSGRVLMLSQARDSKSEAAKREASEPPKFRRK